MLCLHPPSAVCVTGLIAVDTADTYTALGQTVVALLIQIGGLGVTSVGVGVILALGKRVNLKERLLVKEALNLDSGRGIVCLVRNVLITTLCFEGSGSCLKLPGIFQGLSALKGGWNQPVPLCGRV